ncbi:hypothetical protein [Streptomyces sp. YKOK-I1]
MVADDENLALDASFAGGAVGRQDVDVEVVVAGEPDRFRVKGTASPGATWRRTTVFVRS